MNWRSFMLSLWYLSLVHAEGDPIPDEVYAKLSGSAIKSFSDLRSLLRIDSVEDEEDSQWNRASSNSTMSRLKRSLVPEVEPAMIAECKTRTEVFEISRGLVDTTNANFLVWPPCVEVQRCSGCCHTKNMRCTPSRVHVRHVQVNKIKISLKKKVFHKVLVALEDHLECRCEKVTLAAAPHHNHPPGTTRGTPSPTTTPRPLLSTPAPASSRERTRHRPAKRKHRKFKHIQEHKTLKDLYAP